MANVFKNLEYAVQYEQINLDLDDGYGRYSQELIELAQIPSGSNVLELGCGTGISTYRLITNVPKIKVLGVDQSEEFLRMAKLKFGIEDSSELREIIEKGNHYPSILKSYGVFLDLKKYLADVSSKYIEHRNQVEFQQADASELEIFAKKEEFDYVFANQMIHWLRKKDVKPGEPLNYEYEKQVLTNVNNILKPRGYFAFNTSGDDFRFEDKSLNEEVYFNHPFYQAFQKELGNSLEIKNNYEKNYTFDDAEIRRIMKENNFVVNERKILNSSWKPSQLLEICIVGGKMKIFQEMGINIPYKESEQILERVLKQTLSKVDPSQKPIIEHGIHYVAQKI